MNSSKPPAEGWRGHNPPQNGAHLPTAQRSHPLASLLVRDYRWFWLGSVASFLALNMQMVARGWLIYKELNGTAMDVAWFMVAVSLPLVVLGLPGGTISDRVFKRDLAILVLGVSALFGLVIAVLIHTGAIQFWHMLLLGFFNGLMFAFLWPARMSFIPQLVGDRHLVNAMALNQAGMNLMGIVAPAAAGFLIAGFGTAVVFDATVVLYLLAAAAMLLVRDRGKPVDAARRNILGEIVSGLRYVRRERTVLALLVLSSIPMLLGFSYQLLMPVFVVAALNGGSVSLGIFMSVIGVGALTGSFVVAAVASFRWQQVLLFGAALGWGLCIIAFALAPGALVAAVPLLLAGLTGSVYTVLSNSLMQAYALPEMQGRVISMFMLAWGLMPLTLLPTSALSDAIGVRQAFVGSGLLVVLSVVLIYALVPALRRLPPPPYGGIGMARGGLSSSAPVSPTGTAPPVVEGI